jgi:hypothetical protein
MMLVTGPTGSGKTTTLYAMISEINHGVDKIITIEDPVEYQLPGVLQIPVNEKKGLTFARGLRSILRHDPDKILVGEIRDPDTAQIAVQSALTGHLVFTTIHANNVFDVIGRFSQMQVDPYSFVSALNAVLAQRLIRLACPHCATPCEHDDDTCRLGPDPRGVAGWTSCAPGLRPVPWQWLPRPQRHCRTAAPGRRPAANDRRAPPASQIKALACQRGLRLLRASALDLVRTAGPPRGDQPCHIHLSVMRRPRRRGCRPGSLAHNTTNGWAAAASAAMPPSRPGPPPSTPWPAAGRACRARRPVAGVAVGPLQPLLPGALERCHRPRELDAYARACFENLYGQPLDDWRIVLSPSRPVPPASPRRCRSLLQRLQAGGRRLSLRSVQPYLMAAFNRCSRSWSRDFLFVLAEPRRSVLLLAAGGPGSGAGARLRRQRPGLASADRAHLRAVQRAPARCTCMPRAAATCRNWRRCCASRPAKPTRCAPCGGRWPDMRRLDLEFQPRRSGPLAWSLLVLASAVVAGLVLLQQRLQTEQVDLEASVHSLELQLGRRPATAAPKNSAASREQAERLAQMRSVSQQLQRPGSSCSPCSKPCPRTTSRCWPDPGRPQGPGAHQRRGAQPRSHAAVPPAPGSQRRAERCVAAQPRSAAACPSTRCASPSPPPGRSAMRALECSAA